MQDPANELPRIPLLRTRVHKGGPGVTGLGGPTPVHPSRDANLSRKKAWYSSRPSVPFTPSM